MQGPFSYPFSLTVGLYLVLAVGTVFCYMQAYDLFGTDNSKTYLHLFLPPPGGQTRTQPGAASPT